MSDTNMADHEGVCVHGSAAEGYEEGGDLVINLACERSAPLFSVLVIEVIRECVHDICPQKVR